MIRLWYCGLAVSYILLGVFYLVAHEAALGMLRMGNSLEQWADAKISGS